MANLEEAWSPVSEYEGLYEVSNRGNVRSLDRVVRRGFGTMILKGKRIKQHPNSNGYLRVCLYKNSEMNKVFVHRLVATAFVPNPNGVDVVNHLDNNPKNNDASNLEWTTRKGNMEYAREQGRMACTEERRQNILRSLAKYHKPIIGENVKTGEKIYIDYVNGAREYGFSPGEVCRCCKNKRMTTHGFKFHYAEVTE